MIHPTTRPCRIVRVGPMLLTALWCVALSSLCCASARSTDLRSDPERTVEDYSPLSVGSHWTYDVVYPGQSGEMIVRLVGIRDGYFVDDRNGSFRHTKDGLRDRVRYLIKYPLRVGNEWKTIVSASAVEHSKITSVGEPCDSMAGRFEDCLVVESSVRRDPHMALHVRWTWARGVGLVGFETEAELREKGRIPQARHRLRSFEIAGLGPLEARPSTDPEGAPLDWERPR